jgi:N-acetylmuramoyl-L-alanine amidase
LRAAATTVLLALLLCALPLAQSPTPIGVVSAAGRRTLSTSVVNDQEYVALDDVSAFVPLTIREDRQGGVSIGVRGKSIVAPKDRALVSVDGRVVALPAPVIRMGGRWLAPVDFLPRALGLVSDARIEYRRGSRLLIIGSVRVPRVTTRVEVTGTGTRVTLEVAPPAGVMTVTDPDKVVIRLDADAMDFSPAVGNSPAVTQVRGDAPATVTVGIASPAGDVRASTSNTDTAARIVIEITSPNQAPETSSAPAPATPAPPPVLTPHKTGVQTVIIDAGHGGDDGGVRGAGGALEKQVTLDVARRLKTVLEARMGVRVVLTREDDRAVGPDERTATANNAKGDLFVSLHMSSSPSPATTGATVYFMRLDREGEEARREAGAQALALPVLGGGNRVIETIRWDLAQARHVEDSGRLANLLAAALEGHVPTMPQPVQSAPLRVLAGLNMPAVLFEMGYLTNADQEKRATGDEGRTVIVQALYDAVNRFALAPPPDRSR